MSAGSIEVTWCAVVGHRAAEHVRRTGGWPRADSTNATDASPMTNPRLPSWNGRHASSGSASVTATPSRTKCWMFSGVSERSVATNTTSSTMPASSHDFAVIRPGVAGRAHRGDVHRRAVEAVLLHERGHRRRRHEREILVHRQPAVGSGRSPATAPPRRARPRAAGRPAGRAASPGRPRPRSPRARPRAWPGRTGSDRPRGRRRRALAPAQTGPRVRPESGVAVAAGLPDTSPSHSVSRPQPYPLTDADATDSDRCRIFASALISWCRYARDRTECYGRRQVDVTRRGTATACSRARTTMRATPQG